jgi:hypothetical protein
VRVPPGGGAIVKRLSPAGDQADRRIANGSQGDHA